MGSPGIGTKDVVMVVDDEEAVVRLLTVILSSGGYEVLSAPNGYQAFTMMQKRFDALGELKIGLVITDWKMTGWDGLKLLSEIRATKFRNVPVVLMSGAVTREELLEAAKNKADSVLVKPIQKDVILAKVAEILQKRTPEE